jgi:hypothetical protein
MAVAAITLISPAFRNEPDALEFAQFLAPYLPAWVAGL